jgi:poly(A) polymerase
MFATQPRLEQPRGRRALRTLEMPRFRAAFDLLVLRSRIGMVHKGVAEWWARLQEVGPEERDRMIAQLERSQPARDRGAGDEGGEGGAASGAPRRRRRRGRRPPAST